MTRITLNLPDDIIAALGGDPEAIARRLEQWAVKTARPPRNEEPKQPMSEEELEALYEDALKGYDFDAWRKMRQRPGLTDQQFEELCDTIAENYDFNAWKDFRKASEL